MHERVPLFSTANVVLPVLFSRPCSEEALDDSCGQLLPALYNAVWLPESILGHNTAVLFDELELLLKLFLKLRIGGHDNGLRFQIAAS
eukprot:m.634781 g.634781  ORF g.634781 m.634781 type:complete len:88 (-) comp58303_c0_seq20:1346-1609(-)